MRHTDYVDLQTLHSQVRSGNGNDLSNGKIASDSQYMNMKDTDGVVSTYMEMSGNAGHSENNLYVDIRLWISEIIKTLTIFVFLEKVHVRNNLHSYVMFAL